MGPDGTSFTHERAWWYQGFHPELAGGRTRIAKSLLVSWGSLSLLVLIIIRVIGDLPASVPLWCSLQRRGDSEPTLTWMKATPKHPDSATWYVGWRKAVLNSHAGNPQLGLDRGQDQLQGDYVWWFSCTTLEIDYVVDCRKPSPSWCLAPHFELCSQHILGSCAVIVCSITVSSVVHIPFPGPKYGMVQECFVGPGRR